jgi:hypothetical protein
MEWSPRSVCDLYRRRWDIEVFFKQVKQSLKLGSFLGHSANAVRWQVYTALLVYVLLHGAPFGMGAQLHTAVCRHAFGVVGADRSVGSVEILRDSIRAIQGDRSAPCDRGTGL